MNTKLFRKKPVVVEAVQFWINSPDGWPEGVYKGSASPTGYLIDKMEGSYVVAEGDWIITGAQGDVYVCKPDIFEAMYEPVEAPETLAQVPVEPVSDKRVDSLVAALNEIGDYAHDRSTGHAVPDTLWEIRRMAYEAMDLGAVAAPPAVRLPLTDDAIRVPLDEVRADLGYLFGRAAAEGHESAMRLADATRKKLDALHAALGGITGEPASTAEPQKPELYPCAGGCGAHVTFAGMNCIYCDAALTGKIEAAGAPANPHAELRKTYKPGQRWEHANKGMNDWAPCNDRPHWHADLDYRLAPAVSPLEVPAPTETQKCRTCGGTGWIGGPSFYQPDEGGEPCPDCATAARPLESPAPTVQPGAVPEGRKLWLWKNFADGRPEYWAFNNPYPINLTDGDPQTLGEPCGYAIFKRSRQGRTDVSEEAVLRAIARAQAIPPAPLVQPRAVPEGLPYGIIDPDYARVFTIARTLAWAEGYSIAMHGSFTRDLDLVAVPWAEHVCKPEHLMKRIADAAGLCNLTPKPGDKPHGRKSWTLVFPRFSDPRFVDLSIVPAAIPPAPQQAVQTGKDAT